MRLFLLLLGLMSLVSSSASYDPLDPTGKITIRWDVMEWTPDGYKATITILNTQKYRHIEQPGWTLGWTWAGEEFIWDMTGGQTRDRGDCSKFMGRTPHCCKKNPEVIDLLANVPIEKQIASCCRGGVLSSLIPDPSKSVSRFLVTVGGIGSNKMNVRAPQQFTFQAPGPGYTCGLPCFTHLTEGERYPFSTWNVTCMYSSFVAIMNPSCCVSFSAFYDNNLVDCPKCACGCPSEKFGSYVEPNLPYSSYDDSSSLPVVHCTDHLCPVRIHWHIKKNYRGCWRVKITVTNFNKWRNYSEWSVVVKHPNFNNISSVFSLSYYPLAPYDGFNDTAMLSGVPHSNSILQQAGPQGYVQSEILLGKNESLFTWEDGWGFQRMVYFNGDSCVIPDSYPRVPTPTFRSNLPVLDPALVIMVFVVGYFIIGAFCKRM